MFDRQKLYDELSTILLHAWTAVYLAREPRVKPDRIPVISSRLEDHAAKLQESAAQLAAAVEKMRVANAKLALRMAEHKAFFAKYRPQQ